MICVQARILCDEVSRLSQKYSKKGFPSPCIIAGDFNASPESGIYKFMHDGSIHMAQYSSGNLSGTVDGSFIGPRQELPIQNGQISMAPTIFLPPWHPFPSDQAFLDPFLPDAMMIDETRWWPDPTSFLASGESNSGTESARFRQRHSIVYDFKWACRDIDQQIRNAAGFHLKRQFPMMQGWSPDHIENAMGRSLSDILEWARRQSNYDPFVLDHDLHLKSACREVLGQEPKATSLHNRCQNTLDYIFFSPYVHSHSNGRHTYLMLQPFRVLDFPHWSQQERTKRNLPNDVFGSDHFSLCVDFRCKWTGSYAEAGLALPPPSQKLESFMSKSSKRALAQKLQSKKKKRAKKNNPAQNQRWRKKRLDEENRNEQQ